MKKIFAYVGTWPALLRNPLPGFEAVCEDGKDIKTGIFCFLINEDTGEWIPNGAYYTDCITSVLKVSSDGRFLFANDEVHDRHGQKNAGGGVLSFAIDRESGELTLISELPSFGASPSFIDVDQEARQLFAANLGNPHMPYIQIDKDSEGKFFMSSSAEEGTISMYDVTENGELNGPVDVTGFSRDAFSTHINDHSHYHCVCVDPTNQWLLACDTLDRIYVYQISREKKVLMPAKEFCTDIKGKGICEPRFIKFSPDGRFFYINNQHNSTVDVFSFDSSVGMIQHIERKLTVEDEENALKTWTSESAMTEDGRFLYVASRGMGKIMRDMNCPPSSISIFEIDAISGKMEFIEEMYIKAENPRGIAISPNGKYLYAVSMDTNEIYSFQIDFQTGKLFEEKKVAEVPVPSSIVFA